MVQRLRIAHAQSKADNDSENLLREIRFFMLCINQKNY